MRGALVSLAVLVALLMLGTGRASAYHTDRYRVVPGTAFTLHRGETQLGPFRADHAPLERLQLTTFVVPWVALFPNLQTKLLLVRTEHWAASLQPGIFYVNTGWPHAAYGVNFKDTHLELWVVPITGFVSAVIKRRFLLTAAAQYNVVTGKGTYNPQDFRGTAAASNSQLGLDFQWRINPLVALICQGRLVVYQEVEGVGGGSLSLGSNTSVQIRSAGGAAVLQKNGGFSVSLAAFFSFEHLNVRLGIGYGNYSLPGFNVVIPELRPFPVFDLFWRWGDRRARLDHQEFSSP